MAPGLADMLPARLHLVSSNHAFAQSLGASLAEHIDVTVNQIDSASLDADGLVVGIFDVNERQGQLKWQEYFRARNRPFLRVEYEPDSICVGPYVTTDEGGCVECLANWSQTEWSKLNMTNGGEPGAMLDGLDSFGQILSPLLLDYISEGTRTGLVAVHNRATMECLLRRFMPHPSCRMCETAVDDSEIGAILDLSPIPKADPRAFRANAGFDEDALIARFKDRRTGLIRYLFDEPTSSVMPMAVASFVQDGSLTQFENGYGRTTTRGKSRAIAVLETLERYSGYMPRAKRSVVRSSYAALGSRAVDPKSFILHGDGQRAEPGFDLIAYSDDLEINWVWGFSMRRREPILVPEQLVYYRLPNPPGRPSNRFVYEVSNGCAMGASPVEAALQGLFETIERDAFLNSWYARRPPVQLDVSDADNPSIAALVARAVSAGYEVNLFDISSSYGVTAIWGMIVNRAADAPVKSYSAAGASIDPEAAVFGALVEICTSIPVYETKLPAQRAKAEEMLGDPSRVKTMEDHVLLYSHPESIDRFDFLFARPERVKLKDRFAAWYAEPRGADLTEDFLATCDRVLDEAADVIVIDQSFPALVDAGFHCVKVLAPGLTPVTFGHQYRRISLDRLRQYAGPDQAPAGIADINPYPHNFP
jgi:ribosomal protein S12 methylthiotransferase accessory factor